MTTRTQADLARAVMEDLSLLDAGESPSAADADYITRRYTEIFAEMIDDRLTYWAPDAIPLEAFNAVTGLMCVVCGNAFGKPQSPAGEPLNDAIEAAKRRVRKFVVKPASGQPAEVGYF